MLGATFRAAVLSSFESLVNAGDLVIEGDLHLNKPRPESGEIDFSNDGGDESGGC